jgi:hypothetical protein
LTDPLRLSGHPHSMQRSGPGAATPGRWNARGLASWLLQNCLPPRVCPPWGAILLYFRFHFGVLVPAVLSGVVGVCRRQPGPQGWHQPPERCQFLSDLGELSHLGRGYRFSSALVPDPFSVPEVSHRGRYDRVVCGCNPWFVTSPLPLCAWLLAPALLLVGGLCVTWYDPSSM